MQARRYKQLEDMMEHIIGSSHGLRPEELAAETAGQSEPREAPGINVSGGHVVLAIYGNISGAVHIYRQGERESISGSTASTPLGDVS